MTSELVRLSVVNRGSDFGKTEGFCFCYKVKRDDGGECEW
jgi:hypothetical protein